MGVPIASTKYWDDWDDYTTGDGVIVLSESNTKANVTAGAGTGRAYMRKFISARPGEKITVKCIAKRVSGNPQMSIDYPALGTSSNLVAIDSDNWQEYEISYTLPYTADDTSDVAVCTIGIFNSPNGEADIILPRIEVENNTSGFERTWGLGLIRLAKSGGVTTASLNERFVNAGIRGVSYSAGTLTVTLPPSISQDYGLRPIIMSQLTTEFLPDVISKCGNYDQTTGTVDVKFSNGTGSFVDINTLLSDGQTVFLWFRAGGI